jgi:hypothetical protein
MRGTLRASFASARERWKEFIKRALGQKTLLKDNLNFGKSIVQEDDKEHENIVQEDYKEHENIVQEDYKEHENMERQMHKSSIDNEFKGPSPADPKYNLASSRIPV